MKNPRHEKALKELLNNARAYNAGQIDLIEYIDEIEKILYNQVGTGSLKHFNDGNSSGQYLHILKYVTEAAAGNRAALERLLIDLEIIEVNFTIKQVN